MLLNVTQDSNLDRSSYKRGAVIKLQSRFPRTDTSPLGTITMTTSERNVPSKWRMGVIILVLNKR